MKLRYRWIGNAVVGMAVCVGCGDEEPSNAETMSMTSSTSGGSTGEGSSTQGASETGGESDPDASSTTGDDPEPDPNTCEAEPPCEGVRLQNPIVFQLGGWAATEDDGSMTVYLSNPGTACGDERADSCTNCGNHLSYKIVLPAEAQTPGVYDEASGVEVTSSEWVSDCMGNGGGGEGEVSDFQIEVVSITDECVHLNLPPELEDGEIAVSRCG